MKLDIKNERESQTQTYTHNIDAVRNWLSDLIEVNKNEWGFLLFFLFLWLNRNETTIPTYDLWARYQKW